MKKTEAGIVDGFFEVLANHTPMIVMLKHSTVTLRQEGKLSYFIIGSGVLEVNQKHEVLLLVDPAVSTSDLREAHEKLKNDPYSNIFANV